MITVQRQRGVRRAAAVIAAVAVVAGLVLGAAPPAGAATAAIVGKAPGESGSPHGTVGDHTGRYGGGLFDITIDGEPSKAYCIDINTPISGDPTYEEVDWAMADVDDLETVEAILRHYHPNGDGPDGFTLTGSDADRAMATQAAIWHFTDGFDLTEDPAHNPAAVIANYQAILGAVEHGLEGFGEPDLTLAITPPAVTSGETGGLVGPYVVETTADAVTVTPSAGVTLHDATGEPFTGEITDGTELWLSSGSAGEGGLTATASAEATAGRVFRAEGQQTLILAAPVGIETGAEAAVSFRQPPPPSSTTSTTVPIDTTTTMPPTSESTVATTSTTNPVPTTEQGSGGGLPVTGAQSLVLAAAALVLVSLGVGLRYVSKRAGGQG
jgi:TQXA domain-containing protein